MSLKECVALFGTQEIEWVAKDAMGNDGGILNVWNKESFCLENSWEEDGILAMEGRWIKENIQVSIFNVYSSCRLVDKSLVGHNKEENLCKAEWEFLHRGRF